ncbi:hypothetical protein ACR9H8_11375 [Kosakonia cowanii]
MISLAKQKGNTSTGVHMLQRYGKKFKFRCSIETLERFTSVSVKAEHQKLFTTRKDGVYHSDLYDTLEEGKAELCAFVQKVTGITCTA